MWLLPLLLFADTVTVLNVQVAPAETLAVSVAGRGDPVVLLPGVFGSAFGFRLVGQLITADGFQVIVVEPLGIGGSARPRHADYSLTSQAARVAAVLDTLDVEHAIVIAHSLGASIAYRLAVQRPDLVTGIISLDGGPAEEASTPGFRRMMRFAPLLRLFGGQRLVRGQVHHNLLAASGDASWVTEEVVDGYTADAARDFGATLDAYKGMAEAQEPWTLASRLSEISCPVLLLLGTAPHNGAVPPEEIALLRDSLPVFAVDSVPGVGHFVFEEQPSAVLEAMARLRDDRTMVCSDAPNEERCLGLPCS